MIFLSYTLNAQTPSYGNRHPLKMEFLNSISKGDTTNDSTISSTVHIGTHLDMPYHFYDNGQTIESYSADFFYFSKILFFEIQPTTYVIKDELLNLLHSVDDEKYEILLVKTGSGKVREAQQYWQNNHGFHPDIYTLLREKFKHIRLFGFDTISISSFQDRITGKEAHKRFLNPIHPILLLEDMDLSTISNSTLFASIYVAPLRIDNCDGLPCTVIAKLK